MRVSAWVAAVVGILCCACAGQTQTVTQTQATVQAPARALAPTETQATPTTTPDSHPVMQEPPPADANGLRAKPPPSGYVCLQGIGTPVRVKDGEVDCAAPDGRNCLWGRCTQAGPWEAEPGETLAPLVCGLMHARLYGIDGYRDENHWCRAACLTLPGCAHVEESKAPVLQPTPPAPPPHFVPPRPEQTELLPHKREPAKPELMTSDAACQEDADCLVEEHRSCCGCQELRVRAKGPAPREPECGCADFSARQLFGGGGPCGPMPPPVGAFRARCVKHRCAGVPVQ